MSSIVTTIGTNKLANATPLDQLEIIQIAVGDGNGSTPTLDPSQTQLVNEVWRGGVSTPIKGPQENIVIFEGFIPQNLGPFSIREVGIFDPEGDLIAVGTTALVEKPDPATETAITLRIRLHVALESTTDIQLIAQDQGVFDHQGATNRDAAGAHPANSITTAELTALALSASDVQGVLNNLKNAALRAMGAATDEVPDNAQLNTRLGTTGNLGNAAQRTIGTGADQVPDKEILDSRFGGYTGNLGTAARFNKGTDGLSIPDNNQLDFRLGTSGNLGDSAQRTVGTGTNQVPDKEILDSRLGTTGDISERYGEGDNIMVGAVVYFATTVTPSGYIKANGAAVSRTTYANLFARVGEFWGDGNGSTTFNVPDLRGEFIRTYDDGRGIDSGRAFGSFQADEFKSHSHTQRGSNDGGSSYGFQMDNNNNNIYTATSIDTLENGGTETRPRNIALVAYIKY